VNYTQKLWRMIVDAHPLKDDGGKPRMAPRSTEYGPQFVEPVKKWG
jgi:hypothetical protein